MLRWVVQYFFQKHFCCCFFLFSLCRSLAECRCSLADWVPWRGSSLCCLKQWWTISTVRQTQIKILLLKTTSQFVERFGSHLKTCFDLVRVCVQNCGAMLPLNGPGPLTVFIPSNQAVDNARDGSILYMLNDVRASEKNDHNSSQLTHNLLSFAPQAKPKLQELLRNHIYTKGSVRRHTHTRTHVLISINCHLFKNKRQKYDIGFRILGTCC